MSPADRGIGAEPHDMASLAAACAGLPPSRSESVLRRFISRHGHELEAWQALLALVEQRGHLDEALRLVQRMCRAFPGHAALGLRHIQLLLERGRWSEANGLLRQRLQAGPPQAEDVVLFSEVLLLSQPAQAGAMLETLLARAPAHAPARVALRSARSLASRPGQRPEVAFLLGADWHEDIQRSIFDALQQRGVPALMTRSAWLVVALQPRVVVVSDAEPQRMPQLHARLPRSRFVHTRHGLGVGGKNYGLYSAASCHHVCASSPAVAADLARDALLDDDQVWVTGYPQMDALWRQGRAGPRDGGRRQVLFAPTWTPGLSAAELVGADPVAALRGSDPGIRVVLRPHPALLRTAPGQMQAWRGLAAQQPNVSFDPDTDLALALAETDVLVSDVSSAALQFLALDRPIVCLVDEDRARASSSYAPRELEWQLHRAAGTVRRGARLAAAVAQALAGQQPDAVVSERARLRDYLFGPLADGRAGERIADRVLSLLAAAPAPRPGAAGGPTGAAS